MPGQQLKIVFLDAATVDLGDLRMDAIRRQGRYRAIPDCPRRSLPRECLDAEVVITNKVALDGRRLERFPRLRLVCVAATGVNNIDLAAAKRLGIGVCNVAGYSTSTVVEHTLMFLLAFSHRLMEHHQAVLRGEWSRSPFFTLLNYPFGDLEGKSLGVIGYGSIGRRVARLAEALGMRVWVAKIPGRKYGAAPKRFPLKTVLQKSDFVTLHCPLTRETKGLIDAEKLRWMRPSAYLLNLARGPIAVEAHVARALKNNRLAGYGADVTEREPLPKGHPFLRKSLSGKVLLTPHVAWASRESRQRLVDEIGRNIAAFRGGKKRNRIV
jgi:glycerate dehydrogenase